MSHTPEGPQNMPDLELGNADWRDADAMAHVSIAAYSSGTGDAQLDRLHRDAYPRNRLMYQWWNLAIQTQMYFEPSARFLKVIDRANDNRIVAYTKFVPWNGEETRWPRWLAPGQRIEA